MAGHRPIAVAGGGTGFVGDPGGRSRREECSPVEGRAAANLIGIRGQLERFIDFGGDRVGSAILRQQRRLARVHWACSGFLRDVGKHFTVNQMVAKDSVKSRLAASRTGDLLHRVQLHAPAGLRLPPPVRRPSDAGSSWGQRPVGEHHRGHRTGQAQGAPAEVWGSHHPAGGQGRRDQVRQDRVRHGLARCGPDQSVPAVPVPRPQRRRHGRDLPALLHLPVPREPSPSSTRPPSTHPERREAQRELARQVCSLVHGEDETGRAEQAAAALFGEEASTSWTSARSSTCSPTPPRPRCPRHRLDADGLTLVDLLVETGLLPSKGQARTLIESGGAYVNNRRQDDVSRVIGADRPPRRALRGPPTRQARLPPGEVGLTTRVGGPDGPT
jgi:tyrosyl-tRNA synthetase